MNISPQNVLIIGCGRLGTTLGHRLACAETQVLGVRRRESASCIFPFMQADAADPAEYARIEAAFAGQKPDVVVVTATPGVRRGTDTHLVDVADNIVQFFPEAHLIYTSSSYVYADAEGALIDEGGPLASHDPAGHKLLDIERHMLIAKKATVLRVAALVGPHRNFAIERMRTEETYTVRGSLSRPFSYCSEANCAQLMEVVIAKQLCGIYNVAAPHYPSYHDYFASLVRDAETECTILSDGSVQPARKVGAAKLYAECPEIEWDLLSV